MTSPLPRRKSMRRHFMALVWVLLPSSAPAQTAGARAPVVSSSPPACAPRQLASDTVRFDRHTTAYVEPSTVVAGPRSLLILGVPTYLNVEAQRAQAPKVHRDSIVGALRDQHGRWRPVHSPIPGRFPFSFRAVRRGSNEWDVLFIELDKPFNPVTSDSSIGVWHAVLRDTVWRDVRKIAIPDSVFPKILNNGALTRSGDTLTWAALRGFRDARRLDGALLLERYDGTWRYRDLNLQAAWIDVVLDARGRRRLLAVTRDSLSKAPGEAIRLFELKSPLREMGASDDEAPIYVSAVAAFGDGFRATYRRGATNQWRTRVIRPGEWNSPVLSFQGGIRKAITLVGGQANAPALWFTDDGGDQLKGSKVSIWSQSSGQLTRRLQISTGLATPSPVHFESQQRFHVVGPAFAPIASGHELRTILISFDLGCRDHR